MKTTFVISTLVICAMLAPPPSGAFEETADSIIQKSVAAHGGAKALWAINDMVVRGTIRNGGVAGSFTAYSKAPDKSRVDVDLGSVKISEGFDGRIAWQATQNRTRQVTGTEADFVRKEAQDGIGLLVRYKRRGIKVKLEGSATLEGKSSYVVAWDYGDGTTKKLYFDKQSFLLVGEQRYRIQAGGKKVLEWTIYSDFRQAGAVVTPYKLKVINSFGKSEMWVREVQSNTNISPAIFQKPS